MITSMLISIHNYLKHPANANPVYIPQMQQSTVRAGKHTHIMFLVEPIRISRLGWYSVMREYRENCTPLTTYVVTTSF